MTNSSTDRFSVHCSEQLQYNWVDFYIQIQSHNFDTSLVLCHISVVFLQIPFKPQKGTPKMTSTCQVSSNSF